MLIRDMFGSVPLRDNSHQALRLPLTCADKGGGICHPALMHTAESVHPALFSRLIDGLYIEALVMADEARAYFDRQGAADKDRYDTMTRLSFTCESLKVTTRLMHVIAWLMTQKAWQRGEISTDALGDPKYRLGPAADTDGAVLVIMPSGARQLVEGSQSLYARVLRLQGKMEAALKRQHAGRESVVAASVVATSPALELIGRLEKSF